MELFIILAGRDSLKNNKLIITGNVSAACVSGTGGPNRLYAMVDAVMDEQCFSSVDWWT